MPSEAWFYPEMTVKEILELSAKARHSNCDEERKHLCQKLELEEKRKINELSLGNRKKVSIVNAMQHKPQVFIFDEPTSGLDYFHMMQVAECIKKCTKRAGPFF